MHNHVAYVVDYVNYIVLTWPGAGWPAAGTHGEDRAEIAPDEDRSLTFAAPIEAPNVREGFR